MSFADLLKPAVIAAGLERRRLRLGCRALYHKYRNQTLVHEAMYVDNLELCAKFADIPGCVVECGVWRGGMIAGIAEMLGPERQYFLLDSFEGLPPARAEIDGSSAVAWQTDIKSPNYHNNCKAAEEEAAATMRLSGATSFSLIKGWFNQTLPRFAPPGQIAVLRLDCDWYDSVSLCLKTLYPHVAPGGIVIVDDYYVWDGCAHAVNEFISSFSPPDQVPRLSQFHDVTAYLVKPNASQAAKNGAGGRSD